MFTLFDHLPLDLKFNVIQQLECKEVVSISATNSENLWLANENSIWQELMRLVFHFAR